MRTLILSTALLFGIGAGLASAQTPAVRGESLDEFATRLTKYSALRASLEQGLPVLTGADEPSHVRSVERALATRIRDARTGARQGDLFTPETTAALRRILRQIDASTWKLIMDENPGPFPNRVNDAYPKT